MALLAAPARADVGLAPRLGLGAEIDTNYAYRDTDAVAAAVAGGEAGLTLFWVPTLRHRLSWETSGNVDALQPLVNPAPARETASLAQTRLAWTYLTSLRTRLDVSAGVYRYEAPQVFDRRVTYGGDGAVGLAWRLVDSLETGVGAAGGLDADEAAAPDARSDTGLNGAAWMRWTPHWRVALEIRGTGGETTSDDAAFAYTTLGGAAALELRPWRTGTLALRGGWRERRYAARTDRRTLAGAALTQGLGDWNRIELSAHYQENESIRFPYQRSTARLQWVFEPDYWF